MQQFILASSSWWSTCKEERGSQPRATMVEIQWQEWQDDLTDGSGPFADGEGTSDGLSSM
jgi:hypothetical protein